MKALPDLFGNTDKTIRSETFALTVELHRWLGQAIDPFLEGLKPVQAKELKEAFEKESSEKPLASRLLKADKEKSQSGTESNRNDCSLMCDH